MRGGQYQREVTLAMDMGHVNILAAWVGLLFLASQVLFHFIGRADPMTLGSPVPCRAVVVVEIFAP